MKRIISIVLFSLVFQLFAQPWVYINESRIKTTIGHDNKDRMYICEWVDSDNYKGISLHVRTSGHFNFGRIRAGCIIVNDYVFPAEIQDGIYEDSVLMRLNARVLEQIEQDCTVIIKIDGYTVYTEFKETGEEYD